MFETFYSTEKIIEKSRKLFEKGEYDKAVQIFEAPLKKDPKNLDLLLGAAELFCLTHEPQSALREYRKAFKAHPGKVREILDLLNAPPDGVNRSDFMELRLEILIHLRDLNEAFKVIGEADGAVLTRILDRTRNRIAELRKIASDEKSSMMIADLGYTAGLIQEHRQSFEAAFESYTEILKVRREEWPLIHPRLENILTHIRNHAGPFLYMGDLLWEEDPEKSAGYYEKALDLDPESASYVIQRFMNSDGGPRGCWLMGKACLAKGEWTKGADALKKIQDPAFRSGIIERLKKVDPSSKGAEDLILFLGDVLVESNRFAEASKVYTGLNGRVETGLLMGRFQRLIGLDPENIEAARVLGDLCLNQGDLAASINQMRRIVKADPSQADVVFEKAMPLLQDHFEDPELVIFLAELCLNHPEAERPLVLIRRFIRLAPGQAGRAAPMLNALLKADESLPLARVAEAEVLMALGRDREAFQSLNQALSRAPGLLHETLHPISMLLRRSPEIHSDVRKLFAELEGKGVCDPAARLVWAEAAAAGEDFQEAVERLIGCALESPGQFQVLEGLIKEWLNRFPEEDSLVFGLAEFYFRMERYQETSETLNRHLCAHPESAGKVIESYRDRLVRSPGNLVLSQGLLSAYLLGGALDLVLKEGEKLEKVFRPPQIACIHRTMGDACKGMGRLSDAVTFYFQAFKEDTSLAPVYRDRPGLAEGIAERLEKVLVLHPSLAKASLAMGSVLSACGRVEEGVSCLMRLARELPKSRDTVMKYLLHISAKHPMQIAPILGMAEIHILEGRDEPALDLLWKAVQRHTQDTDVILGLLNRIAEKNPKMARVQLEIGKVYLKAGVHAKAAEHIAGAVGMDPSLSEQGIKFCHDILSCDPSEISAYGAVSRIFVRMGRPAAALSFLSSSGDAHPEIREKLLCRMEEIAGAAPDQAEILKILAWSYLKAGKPGSSVRSMERALALDHSSAGEGEKLFTALIEEDGDHAHADARLGRCRCRLNLLDLKGAFEDVRRSVLLDPEKMDAGIDFLHQIKEKGLHDAALYLLLGDLFAMKGAYESGIRILQEGLKTASGESERVQLLIRLADQMDKAGDFESAGKMLEQARDLSRDHAAYYAKMNEFTLGRIQSEVRELESRADHGKPLSQDEIKRLVAHLVLLDRQDRAEEIVRHQTASRESGETRAVWAHFHEQAGNYALAEACSDKDDRCHRVYLLESAGEPLLAASVLDQALKESPDPILYEKMKESAAVLMEESLLKERRPLMGKTRLKIPAA